MKKRKSGHPYPVNMRARDLFWSLNTFLFQHDGTCRLSLSHDPANTYTVTLHSPYNLAVVPDSVVPGWCKQYGAFLSSVPCTSGGYINTFTFR